MSKVRIGISGWHYEPWRGVFYPKALPADQELTFASQQLGTIELNASFYRLQKPDDYRKWHRATPADFIFAVKAPRFLTHVKRLKQLDDAFGVFLASGPLLLRNKLGPFLWQLPRNFRYHREQIEAFFAFLPRTGKDACEHARRHGGDVASTDAFARRRLRHVLEVRHPSFLDGDFIELARQYDVAVAVSDGAGRWPMIEDVTASFVYVRLHGDKMLYASRYEAPAIRHWADRIQAWRDGFQPASKKLVLPDRPPGKVARDVYVYFDNDANVDAPFDAQRLVKRLDKIEQR